MRIKLATINLEALDPERSKQFYIDALGMRENEERSHPPSFFYLESEGCALTLASPERSEDTAKPGRTMELGFETDDIEGARGRLSRVAGSVETKSMGWGDVLETYDHDGHRVIVYELREA